jgi:hypothetical protein
MKKLLALIKTKGKTRSEITDELKTVLKNKNMLNADGELQVVILKKSSKSQKYGTR